jgi:hypothetical protein
MAWTTPASWSTNEVVTAAKMNTHVRDNVAFLGSPPSVAVNNSASVSVANATFTVMLANTELWDTDTMHSTSSNTSRLTATTAGRYQLNVTMRFGVNATGSRVIAYRVNGVATDIQLMAVPNAGGSVETVLSGSADIVMAAADYVECTCWQSAGGNLDVILQSASLTLVTVV